MINLFKNQQPLVFILIPVLILSVWIFSGFHYFNIASDNGMPLYSLVVSIVKSWPLWILVFIGFLMIVSQCLHLNWILSKYEVLYKPSYLPALFYFLFSAFLPQFVIFHPLLFVNSILLVVLSKIFQLYKNTMPLSIAFDACLLISLASLFYLPALVFSFLFFVSLSILKPFSWRDWLVGLMGLILPYFFVFVVYFLLDRLQDFLQMLYLTPLMNKIEIYNLLPQGYQLSIVVISVLFIATLIRLRNNFYKNDIKTRNYQQVVIIFILSSAGSALLTREAMLFKLCSMLIPLSVVVSNYFLSIKKGWWAEIMFLFLVATVVFNYFISY